MIATQDSNLFLVLVLREANAPLIMSHVSVGKKEERKKKGGVGVVEANKRISVTTSPLSYPVATIIRKYEDLLDLRAVPFDGAVWDVGCGAGIVSVPENKCGVISTNYMRRDFDGFRR